MKQIQMFTKCGDRCDRLYGPKQNKPLVISLNETHLIYAVSQSDLFRVVLDMQFAIASQREK